MSPSVCQNCGSRRFRADRSMAGRLICQNCGLALGSRPSRSSSQRSTVQRSSQTKKWSWLLALVAVVIIVIVILG